MGNAAQPPTGHRGPNFPAAPDFTVHGRGSSPELFASLCQWPGPANPGPPQILPLRPLGPCRQLNITLHGAPGPREATFTVSFTKGSASPGTVTWGRPVSCLLPPKSPGCFDLQMEQCVQSPEVGGGSCSYSLLPETRVGAHGPCHWGLGLRVTGSWEN